jgi:hypothetical protein
VLDIAWIKYDQALARDCSSLTNIDVARTNHDFHVRP